MSDDDEFFDRVFDLNEDALFALQQQLATYEKQQMAASVSVEAKSLSPAVDAMDLATVSAAFENDDDFFDDDFPFDDDLVENVKPKNSAAPVAAPINRRQSVASADEISEQVRRLQYQIQLLQLENEQIKKDKESILREKLGRDGEVSIVRSRLSQIENDNAKLKMELLKQETLKKNEITKVASSLKDEIETLKTRLLFESNQENNASAFHPKQVAEVNTAFEAVPVPDVQQISLSIPKPVVTEPAAEPKVIRTRKIVYRKSTVPIAAVEVMINSTCSNVGIEYSENDKIESKLVSLSLYVSRKDSKELIMAVVHMFYLIVTTDCNFPLTFFSQQQGKQAFNDIIKKYFKLIECKSKVSQLYFCRMIGKFVESLKEQEWLEIETAKQLAQVVSINNIGCILKFTIIVSEKQHLIQILLSSSVYLFENIGKVLCFTCKDQCEIRAKILNLFAHILEKVSENEILLHQFVKETLGYILLIVVMEFENRHVIETPFKTHIKLAIDLSELMYKLSEGNQWLLEQTLAKRICVDQTSEPYASVSAEALMNHVQKRNLLGYLINNS